MQICLIVFLTLPLPKRFQDNLMIKALGELQQILPFFCFSISSAPMHFHSTYVRCFFQVELLQAFVADPTHRQQQQQQGGRSALHLDLSAVLKNQSSLFAFMQFLKEEGALNQLQFCLSVGEKKEIKEGEENRFPYSMTYRHWT